MGGVGQRLLNAACVVAVIHALPSFYWAAGGSAFVWTVGSWASDLQRDLPVLTAFTLGVVGILKLAGGVVPLFNAAGRLRAPRVWWWACVAGGVVLVFWGGANTVLGGASLLGAFGAVSPADRHALAGHVLLWDPLFLIWGALLLLGLRAPARSVRAGDHPEVS
ncbi:DUF3995 domain-containing protein [Dermatophilaceae bacterium Sec6.4]